MLECVINVSEGRQPEVVAALASVAGSALLDVHTDRHHHRSVLTLAGPSVEEAARTVTAEAVRRLDLTSHAGAHPRLGVVDVVPFVPLDGSTMDDAVAARDRFAAWVASELGLPCFLYGPLGVPEQSACAQPVAGRSLPEIRRLAFATLTPDHGPAGASATAGAVCAGARPLLVAYNLWLAAGSTLASATDAARAVRSDAVRALGLQVGDRVQVSMNLTEPLRFGPAEAYAAVAGLVPVAGAELVGLVPAAVLAAVPRRRWEALDIGLDRTIEGRLGRALDQQSKA